MSELKHESERIDDIGFGTLSIIQNREWFCYGIDAVLAADFVKVKKGGRIADLGTGSGIIPLILSHKTEADLILGIEVQEEAVKLAWRNVARNDLEKRIRIIHMNVTEVPKYLEKGTFDTVVSNPPYASGTQGLKNSASQKSAARHEIFAALDDFVNAAAALLKPRGEFCLVHRPARLADIIASVRAHRLEPKEIRFVYPKRTAREPNIMLLRCKKYGGPELKFAPPLYVYEEDGSYTKEILSIYER